ncbi:hypothetical protein [Streptomyces sp. M92]|uniref:hypothetical protein n=1 Tax=Streptomyces sp. M92 TaxID=2944250 RepID=UPI00234BC0F2|nr:hypothetical protein [Streptomyces sp. M92]WCN05867.1 hypothetical protein M6G08_29420 [Streptomyces sp. M92]
MNTGLRITAFTAALAAAFGSAYGVGTTVEPVVAESAPAPHDEHGRPSAEPEEGGGHVGHETAPAGGLQISEKGYTLDLATPRVTAGERTELRFTVRDARGDAVTAYQREHGKELHLIVASRDLVTYRHLHPTRAADGTWRTPVDLPGAGGYRVFADFTPAKKGAENLTLGADLAASGRYEPAPLPAPNAAATTGGYQVELAGSLSPGRPSELRLKVSRDGEPVTDLQPYLGAYGHLVALRSGDLAYLHVHPNGEPGDGTTSPGPEISFTATAPTAGTYRLFLDFQHGGEVHTAAFTVRAGAAPGTQDPAPATTTEHTDGHGH